MSFLSDTETDILFEMSQLHAGEKGKKLWLLGENDCTIVSMQLRQTRFKDNFIAVELKREKCFVSGLKNKVDFVNHTEFIFNADHARQFLQLCNYDLKEKPATMHLNEYLSHVKRRMDTFIGFNLKVVCSLYKQPRKDDFGRQQQRNKYYDVQEDILDMRMKLVYGAWNYKILWEALKK